MFLIDIGVNLMNPTFNKDRQSVIEAAQKAGVKKLLITSIDIENSITVAAFAKDNSCYKATAGMHPHYARNWNKEAAVQLRELLPLDAVVAVGECGLDYNRNYSPPLDQRLCFEEQLALAQEFQKPVFLHERDAFDDFYSILKQYRSRLPGAVVHCFTGTASQLDAYLALDCYIGITGWVCDERRGSGLIPLIKQIPADRLLLETDAPYMFPRNIPYHVKKGRNEPAFLIYIANFIAEITGKEPEQIAEETSANSERLFAFK